MSIIQGVTVDIADGEFVVLVGPSGCGKSTLLRMVAGLETITSGEIAIDGRVVNKLEPKERDIAMVFQNYALYPQMTVAQNLGFALELARLGKDEIKRKVAAAAASLGLEPLLGRYPRQLSGGQRQRVAMGRAIVRDPKVFLFDEPLSNLDAKLRVQVRGEIKELQRRLKTTTIYVTHDQVEAMTMGDKIVVLNGGRVEQIGAPLDLYDRPANRFVATFLGSPAMNLIEGKIDSHGALALPDGCSAAIGPTPAAWTGRKVLFGIRPEAVRFDPEAGLACVVSLVEPTGSETHLIAHAGQTEIVAVLKERMRNRRGRHRKALVRHRPRALFRPGVRPPPRGRLKAGSGRPRRSAKGGECASRPSPLACPLPPFTVAICGSPFTSTPDVGAKFPSATPSPKRTAASLATRRGRGPRRGHAAGVREERADRRRSCERIMPAPLLPSPTVPMSKEAPGAAGSERISECGQKPTAFRRPQARQPALGPGDLRAVRAPRAA